MKLRNKKTGEVVELKLIQVNDKYLEDHEVDLLNGEKLTLESLADSFADVKEPLIKDEKIRKVVRAWAEANELDEVYLSSNGYEIYGGINDTVMQFTSEPFPFADEKETFTIAELCGEEGE